MGAPPKSFRKGEDSLKELDTIRPFIMMIKRQIRWWFWTNIWFWGGLVGGLYGASQGWITTVCVVGVLWAGVTIFFYFKTNGRNGRCFGAFKEWENIKETHFFAKHYKALKNFLCLLVFLDALIWPVTFIFKIPFWILYRAFRFRVGTVRKMIIRGTLILNPSEEELFNDPFYRFLIQEGLYEDAIEVATTGKLPPKPKPEKVEENKEVVQEATAPKKP